MSPRAATFLLTAASVLITGQARADHTAVLVTGRNCAMNTINMLDVRKAYFGITVSFEDQHIRAMRLKNDKRLNQIFYQSVVAMPERLYERRLISMALKFGVPRPRIYDSVEQLVADIEKGECAIAYVWQEDADAHPQLKTIRLIWRDD